MINILNFRPLDYIIYMFITLNMHAFVLIECYLLFDPQTQIFVNIMVGREREREEEEEEEIDRERKLERDNHRC